MSYSTPLVAPDSGNGVLPEPFRDLPLRVLHLSTRTHNALRNAAITTAADVFDAQQVDSEGDIPTSAIASAKKHLDFLLNSLTHDQQIDWSSYWAKHYVKVIPAKELLSVTPGDIVTSLPSLVQEILQLESRSSELSDRAWTIVKHRFELVGAKKMAQEDLGHGFDLTRQRVDQIEKEALNTLRAVLLDQNYAGKDYHVHPAILHVLQNLPGLLIPDAAINAFGSVSEAGLLQRVTASLGVKWHHVGPSIALWLTMIGFKRLEFEHSDVAPIWSRISGSERKVLESGLKQINDVLTNQTGAAMADLTLLEAVNRAQGRADKLTLHQLRGLVELCSTIERREDGLVWGKFHHLRRVNQVERLLLDADRGLDLREMVREINHRLSEHGARVQVDTLRNQITEDERFAPIGRSGSWKLKTWPHISTDTIVDLMEQGLTALNRPATVEEIYAYVQERRGDVNKKSILLYLQKRAAFARAERTKWGLAIWPETRRAHNWNREQVANFVEQVFKKHRTKELPYQTLRTELMSAADVTAKEAQGLLNRNPAVRTRKKARRDERIAIFQRDYKEKLADAKSRSHRNTVTLREQVCNATYRILDAEPRKEMPHAQLIARLQQEFQCPRPTLYSYVAKLDFVTRFAEPGSTTKICRLKGNHDQESLRRVAQEIGNADLKENVERAVDYLTEDSVDIGLFLLGKEFESTLKKYLKAAAANGNVSVSRDPEKMKLVDLVSCAKQNGLIQAEGEFQYLRHQRNDRAHEPAPSLAERQAMLDSAPHFASMYISYIKLLDQLHRRLGQN